MTCVVTSSDGAVLVLSPARSSLTVIARHERFVTTIAAVLTASALAAHAHAHAQAAPSEWHLAATPLWEAGMTSEDSAGSLARPAGLVRLASGVVVVADQQNLNLRYYTPEGRLQGVAGRRGGGPGEFQSIKAVRECASDSAFVYDPALNRISIFSRDGRFARAIDLRREAGLAAPPYDVFCHRVGTLVAVNRSPVPPAGKGPRRPVVELTRLQLGGVPQSLGMLPGPERYFDGSQDIPRPLGRSTFVAVGARETFVATGDYLDASARFALRRIPHAATRADSLVLAGTRVGVSRAHRATFVAEYLAPRVRSPQYGYLRRLYEEMEYPREFPSVGALWRSSSNNLWVGDYPIPGSAMVSYRVVAGVDSGARMAVPRSFQLLDVVDDVAIGIWRDELDVATVRAYRIERKRPGARQRGGVDGERLQRGLAARDPGGTRTAPQGSVRSWSGVFRTMRETRSKSGS